MIKAVIFDMDGVLIDSQPLHYKADMLTLLEQGVEADMAVLEGYAGTSTINRFTSLKERFNIEAEAKQLEHRREEIGINLLKTEGVVLISGIKELLEDIKRSGLLLTVASSSPYEFINEVLFQTGIAKYFDSLTSGVDVVNGKPAPDVFLLAANRLGCTAEEYIVIEDSENGVNAAVAAKMRVVGFYNPTSGNQCLENANIIIDDFKSINCEFLKEA